MARGLASHLPLQHAINLLRYRKGAVVQHRPQHPHVGGFECLFGLSSCTRRVEFASSTSTTPSAHWPEYCRVAIQPDRRCVDDHIGNSSRRSLILTPTWSSVGIPPLWPQCREQARDFGDALMTRRLMREFRLKCAIRLRRSNNRLLRPHVGSRPRRRLATEPLLPSNVPTLHIIEWLPSASSIPQKTTCRRLLSPLPLVAREQTLHESENFLAREPIEIR